MKRLLAGLMLCIMTGVCAKEPEAPPKEPKAPQKPKREIADKVLGIIYHSEGTILICQSDLKDDLSGRKPTLRDVIIKELIVLDGKKLKIPVSEDEVDRALARAQEQLEMTRDELIGLFKQQGYTLDEARKELEKSIMVENVIDARIKTKAQVSQRALEKYHNDNPLVFYGLSQAFVPFKGGSKALTRALVKREIASGEIAQSNQWTDIGMVNGTDFAPEKAYIKDLAKGTVVISDESDDGISLLRLDSKKVTPFEERKNDIAGLLGQEKYMKAQNTYYDKLLKNANIRYIT